MIKKVSRSDSFTIRSEPTLTREGLRCTANFTRTGVFEYKTTDGKVIHELRPEEEVFSEESLKSYALIPVTDEHPPEPVTSSNAQLYQKGSVGDSIAKEVINDEFFIVGNIIINRDDLINKVLEGKREVSVRYSLDIDPTPGIYKGVRYDRIQRNIRANHLAVVTKGRAGPLCSIRLDSTDNQIEDTTMDKYTVKMPDGSEFTGTLAEVLAKLGPNNVDSKTSEAEKARTDAAKELLKSERDNLAAENDKLRKRVNDLEISAKSIRRRIELESRADSLRITHKDVKDRDLRVALVKSLQSKIDTDNRSDDYLDAIIDTATLKTESVTKAGTSRDDSADTSQDVNEVDKAIAKRRSLGKL